MSGSQRVAIVTGASRGIGRRVAERLASEGLAVLVGFHREADRAGEVVAGIVGTGGRARVMQVDVADGASVRASFEAATSAFGGVDVVVHAAATLPHKPLVEFSDDELDAVLRTNLLGTLLVNREAARRLRRGGTLVNVSSAIMRNLAPGYLAYAATKAGLETATRILARELSGRDITVNAVAPGPTDTEMFAADLANSPNGAAMRQAIVDATPLQRIGTPDDIADLVCFLVGPARWVNGQVIHASGGLV